VSTAEIIAIIKDIVVLLTAGIAGYVGLRGLSTWQRQLRGNAEHQLARSILTNTFELRDRIAAVRYPGMSYDPEPNLPPDKLAALSQEEKNWHAYSQEYQRRWEPISAVKAKLAVNLWEAEALLRPEIVTKAREFDGLLATLLVTIQIHVRNRNPANKRYVVDLETEERHDKILYGIGDESDEFSAKVNAIIADLEKQLRRYVTR
jgi:ribosome-associated translation inhibitor RaiA